MREISPRFQPTVICTRTYIYSILDNRKDFFFILGYVVGDVSREAKKPSQITSSVHFCFFSLDPKKLCLLDILVRLSSFCPIFLLLWNHITFQETQNFKKHNFWFIHFSNSYWLNPNLWVYSRTMLHNVCMKVSSNMSKYSSNTIFLTWMLENKAN